MEYEVPNDVNSILDELVNRKLQAATPELGPDREGVDITPEDIMQPSSDLYETNTLPPEDVSASREPAGLLSGLLGPKIDPKQVYRNLAKGYKRVPKASMASMIPEGLGAGATALASMLYSPKVGEGSDDVSNAKPYFTKPTENPTYELPADISKLAAQAGQTKTPEVEAKKFEASPDLAMAKPVADKLDALVAERKKLSEANIESGYSDFEDPQANFKNWSNTLNMALEKKKKGIELDPDENTILKDAPKIKAMLESGDSRYKNYLMDYWQNNLPML